MRSFSCFAALSGGFAYRDDVSLLTFYCLKELRNTEPDNMHFQVEEAGVGQDVVYSASSSTARSASQLNDISSKESEDAYHTRERLMRIFTAQQIPPTPLEEHSQIVDISPREIVQANLEHVQNNVGWYHTELGKISEERNVLRADTHTQRIIRAEMTES